MSSKYPLSVVTFLICDSIWILSAWQVRASWPSIPHMPQCCFKPPFCGHERRLWPSSPQWGQRSFNDCCAKPRFFICVTVGSGDDSGVDDKGDVLVPGVDAGIKLSNGPSLIFFRLPDLHFFDPLGFFSLLHSVTCSMWVDMFPLEMESIACGFL